MTAGPAKERDPKGGVLLNPLVRRDRLAAEVESNAARAKESEEKHAAEREALNAQIVALRQGGVKARGAARVHPPPPPSLLLPLPMSLLYTPSVDNS